MSNNTYGKEASAKGKDAAPQIRHLEDMDWELNRFDLLCKFPFHPTTEAPNVPNAGVIKFKPGSGFVRHRHDFAQVWYVISGQCQYGGEELRPGSIVFHDDPHFEHELYTEHGCEIFFMQYPGPHTRKPPLYEGRMNLAKPESAEEFDLSL